MRTHLRTPSGRRDNGRASWLLAILAAAFFALFVLLASGSTANTVPLALAIPWDGADSGCPAGYSPTTECHLRRGGPVAVPGFGYVAESYIFAAETATQPSCPAGEYKALSYSATITAKGRGELFLSVAGSDKCLQTTTTAILDVTQTFTVNGGSGVFAGASGSGTLTRTNTGFGAHGYGVDHWDGTLVAPSFEPDVTPPTITGASKKVVRAPRKARTVRVRYRVAATDDVDQHVTVRCKPRSGSRFKVPSLTRVRCSATDTSANTATARFVVVVRRR
jgi:hypothetical protein